MQSFRLEFKDQENNIVAIINLKSVIFISILMNVVLLHRFHYKNIEVFVLKHSGIGYYMVAWL